MAKAAYRTATVPRTPRAAPAAPPTETAAGGAGDEAAAARGVAEMTQEFAELCNRVFAYLADHPDLYQDFDRAGDRLEIRLGSALARAGVPGVVNHIGGMAGLFIGIDRVRKELVLLRHLDAKNICKGLWKAASSYCGDAGSQDDFTVLVTKRDPE